MSSAVVFSVPCPLEGYRRDVSTINGGILRMDASSCTPRGQHCHLPFDQVRIHTSDDFALLPQLASREGVVAAVGCATKLAHDWRCHHLDFQRALPAVPITAFTSSFGCTQNMLSSFDSMWIAAFPGTSLSGPTFLEYWQPVRGVFIFRLFRRSQNGSFRGFCVLDPCFAHAYSLHKAEGFSMRI